MIPPGSSGLARRFRFGESSDNVAQLSELLAERRFRTQVTLNEIAENEHYRFLSRTISKGGTTNTFHDSMQFPGKRGVKVADGREGDTDRRWPVR